MRAAIFILILVVLVAIGAVATGLVDIRQIRGAEAPQMSADQNGITAKGGQTPKFDVETGSVAVGTEQRNVAVPRLKVETGNAQVSVPTVRVEPSSNTTTNSAR